MRIANVRPRLSLLTALLLMTIVGLAIGVFQLWREVGPLRAEVRRLHDETGYLDVADKSKFYAIRVNTSDELTWKWRVWIPEGRFAQVGVSDSIAPNQLASGSGTIFLSNSGECVVEFRIQKDPRAGEWNGTLNVQSGGSVGKYAQPWIDWRSTSTSSEGVDYKNKEFAPGQRIKLQRHVVTDTSSGGKSKSKSQPTASGFELWIDTK